VLRILDTASSAMLFENQADGGGMALHLEQKDSMIRVEVCS
jgi:hypothetical protein